MRRRRCGFCKEIYITTIDTPIYCTDSCKKKAMRDKRERWKEKNPNYMKKYMRKYRSNHEKQSSKNTKQCSKCGTHKELNEKNFSKKSANRDHFDTWCKNCKKDYDSTRYKSKREEILQSKKEYYQKNKEHIKKRQLEYHHSKKSSL
ncbi:hypothetical protein [Vagococcus fluvialis]|uniref:NinG protein n=1 Tax=Vagococcus fluvialis TaxID=2738 RepID=A0A7X6I1U7_9ENTE|nr:hypothetical protein [Vagococcus fluvialis]NKC66731.1 hypothetical protein [Vagococcus fluvialis]